jgi:hypothetical protein
MTGLRGSEVADGDACPAPPQRRRARPFRAALPSCLGPVRRQGGLAATVIPVATLGTDLGRQAVEATIQVVALPRREAAATIVGLQAQQAVEVATQTGGFATAQLAGADPLVDATVQTGLAGVDRLTSVP